MSGVLSLPLEVLGIIATNARAEDLGNLRLVCRQFNATATKPFGHACFAHHRIVLGPKSLKGLLDLTAHPVFGPCVRSISIGSYLIGKEWSRDYQYAEEDYDNFDPVLYAASTAQWGLIESGMHIDLLAKALANLAGYGKKVTLGVFDDVIMEQTWDGPNGDLMEKECYQRCYGSDELYKGIALKDHNKAERQPDLAVEIWEAACNGADIPGLIFDLEYDHDQLSMIAKEAALDKTMRKFSRVQSGRFKHKIDLDLRLRFANADGEGTGDLKIRHEDLSLGLHGHSLDGAVDYDQHQPSLNSRAYGYLKTAIHQAHFAKIVVTKCRLDSSFLTKFIPSKSATLRHLTMCGITFFDGFYGDEDGSETLRFLRILKDDLSLDYLELQNFNPNDMTTDWELVGEGGTIMRGKEDVKAGLEELIRYTLESDQQTRRFIANGWREPGENGPTTAVGGGADV